MPFTSPPTFSDGAVLTAAQLNTLSDNQDYLNGLAAVANVPFARTSDPLDGAGVYFQARHRLQYLNVYINWGVDNTWVDHIDLDIYVNGTSVHSEELTGDSEKYINIDIDGMGTPPASGAWYEIEVDTISKDAGDSYTATTGLTYHYIERMFEADTAAS